MISPFYLFLVSSCACSPMRQGTIVKTITCPGGKVKPCFVKKVQRFRAEINVDGRELRRKIAVSYPQWAVKFVNITCGL